MACEQCKQSYLDSYDVMVDVLKEQNPTAEAHDIRILAAKKFRPIHREMKQSSAVENSGNLEYENGEFIVTDEGKMFYPSTGQYAEDFHLNQLRLSKIRHDPNKYSLTDHQTTLLVQTALSEGAKIVRTSYPRDGEDNRDIFEFRINPETRRGKIIVNNTAQDGNFHNLQEIKQIARQNADSLSEVAPLEKVFILSDAKVDEDKARSIVQSIMRGTEEQLGKNLVHNQQQLLVEKNNRQRVTNYNFQNRETRDQPRSKQETIDLSLGVQRDIGLHTQKTRETVKSLYIIAERNVAIGAIPIFLSSLTIELPKPIRAVEKSIARHQRKERKRLIASERRKARKLRVMEKEGIERRVVYLKKKKETLAVPIKKVENIHHVVHTTLKKEGRIVFPLKKEYKPKKKKDMRRVIFRKKEALVFQQSERKLTKEVQLLRRKEKRQRKQFESLTTVFVRLSRKLKKTDQLSKIRQLHSEKQTVTFQRNEQKAQRQNYSHVLEHRNISQAGRKLAKEWKYMQKRELREREKKKSLEFSFALTLWMLLHISEKTRENTLISSQQNIEKSSGKEILSTKNNHKVSSSSPDIRRGGLREKVKIVLDSPDVRRDRSNNISIPDFELTSGPWILLAIIWYLTAMREQGWQSSAISSQLSAMKHKKKQGKKKKRAEGVLFAYDFRDMMNTWIPVHQ